MNDHEHDKESQRLLDDFQEWLGDTASAWDAQPALDYKLATGDSRLTFWTQAEAMPISEAARADLYTGLAEVLGPDRAEILMAQLPRFDPADVATKTDVAESRAATRSDVAELRSDLRDGLAAVNQRLDRLFLTLLVGMFGVVGALISLVFTVS